RYRKKVRADVQAELAAHFEDELKDCTTDEEKEQRAEQLIEQFGDAKLLGILLRRAKKRCRPLWRTIVALTFQTIGILILLSILYTAWFISGKPNVSIDYLAVLNEKAKPELSEEDNAWPHYEKAIELYVKPSKYLEKTDAFREIKNLDGLDEQTRREIQKWLNQNQQSWQEFVIASSKQFCYRKVEYNSKDEEKWLWNILAPELGTLRGLAKVGMWQSRIAVEQGQTQQGLENCLAIIRTGRLWQAKGTIIEQLVGLVIGRLGHNGILYIAETQDISADDLTKLQKQLSHIYPNGYSPMDIEAERITFMDIVQHTFTDGGLGGGHLIPERLVYIMELCSSVKDKKEFGRTLLYTGPALIHARRDETIAKANEIYDQLVQISKMTPYQRSVSDISDEEILLSVRKWRYQLISVFTPAIGRASELVYRFQALHDATLVVLAILRYEKERGKLPENMRKLVEDGYLNKLPLDPYSDKPLVYGKTDDGFTLYSVGLNFKDDGGEVARSRGRIAQWGTDEEGDAVFWPIRN
ncbi:MAG: hypothetical protein DRP62_05065, partial [Planctomycetota bacterium]